MNRNQLFKSMATVEKGGGEKGEKGASGATEDPPVLTRQTISAGGENNNESYTFLNAIGKVEITPLFLLI